MGFDTPSLFRASLEDLLRESLRDDCTSSFSASLSVALLLRFRAFGSISGVAASRVVGSLRLGVIGLVLYEVVGVYAEGFMLDAIDDVLPFNVVINCSGSGLGEYAPLPYCDKLGGAKPGVIGVFALVGLRGDSGLLRSSLNPFRYVGLMRGFEISICRESSLALLRLPPLWNSFFVDIFRARLKPELDGAGAITGRGVGRSGVGRGYTRVSQQHFHHL
jgi:hypothetical protein